MIEKPNEEIHRVRSGIILNTGTYVPVEFRVCHPPRMWMHAGSPTWKLSKLVVRDFYGGFIM